MVCKQVVKDPRLITLIDHFFGGDCEYKKQTKRQQEEMQMIMDKAELASVFCLAQIQVNFTQEFENKVYVLELEERCCS